MKKTLPTCTGFNARFDKDGKRRAPPAPVTAKLANDLRDLLAIDGFNVTLI